MITQLWTEALLQASLCTQYFTPRSTLHSEAKLNGRKIDTMPRIALSSFQLCETQLQVVSAGYHGHPTDSVRDPKWLPTVTSSKIEPGCIIFCTFCPCILIPFLFCAFACVFSIFPLKHNRGITLILKSWNLLSTHLTFG